MNLQRQHLVGLIVHLAFKSVFETGFFFFFLLDHVQLGEESLGLQP